MAPTTIGNTNHPIIIYDHATYASATWAWYLPASSFRYKWPMRFTDGTYQSSPGGITTGQLGFYLDLKFHFNGIDIVGETDNTNLNKALMQWHAQNTLLYLSVIPKELTKGIFRCITYALAAVPTWGSSDANLTLPTGRLQNLVCEGLLPNGQTVGIEFVYMSS
jgi:hypothetical protein